MVAFGLIAYIIVRTTFYGRGALDFLVWLPSTLPGIVMGLGYLWLFLGTPFLRPIYGTTFILILVASLGSITLTTQILKGNLLQLGAELEEASSVSGGSWWRTLCHVTLPLIAPSWRWSACWRSRPRRERRVMLPCCPRALTSHSRSCS